MEQPLGSYARQGAAQDLVAELEDPRGMGATSPELMIPASMFPKGCKEGSEVMVKGTVGKMGNKVGFTPTEIKPCGGMESNDSGDDEGPADAADPAEAEEA